MKTTILLMALALALVSCGKNGIQFGEVKKKVRKKSRQVVVARNNDVLVIEKSEELSLEDQAALEGRVRGEEGSDLPLPEGEVASSEGVGVEISTSAEAVGGYTTGTNDEGFAASGSASVIIDIIDNARNQVLWTIPINGVVGGVVRDGRFVYNRVNFDVNVQKILHPYFSFSGEFLGSWNESSQLQRRLYGGVGLNLDIFGNMQRSGISPQIITSFYLQGGQDQLAGGAERGRARGSFRIELRDIYLTDTSVRDNVGVKLFGRLDTTAALTDIDDNYISAEAGISILTPEFIEGMRVGVAPSYRYNRIQVDGNSPIEHQHMFNIAFSLDAPRIRVNR